MRFVKRPKIRLILTLALCATAIPVLGQDAPKSILPPGFGEPPAEPKAAPPPPRQSSPSAPKKLDLDNSVALTPPPTGSESLGVPPTGLAGTAPADDAKPDGDEEIDIAEVLPDLPPSRRKSLALIGVLGANDGDFGADAYGTTPGLYLDFLMQKIKAPIASRWASIALRRSLLSQVRTPAGVNGADFAAQRALLLLRMGEAWSARQLVQAVDADQSSAFLREVGLQAALANADPGAACPLVDHMPPATRESRWRMARAICFALNAEPAQASALIDNVRDGRGGVKASTIDVILAEKIIGAGGNSRRSVNILWEGVSNLSSWRYGLASAAAVPVPQGLMATVGPQVRAWRAVAPLLPPESRVGDAEIAAALGVFSSDGLMQAYAEAADSSDAGNERDSVFVRLREAYSAPSADDRLTAMESLWSSDDPQLGYARLIATARAATEIEAASGVSGYADQLIASMLTAGFDLQAVRWAELVGNGSLGQGLLAVAAPRNIISYDAGDVTGFGEGESGKRAQFLLAGLAGLGRLTPSDASSAADSLEVPLGREDSWTRALDRAVARSEKGTVTLLVALGLQGRNWSEVSAHRLYRAISAMRRVGMDGEARMIAAEALMRS